MPLMEVFVQLVPLKSYLVLKSESTKVLTGEYWVINARLPETTYFKWDSDKSMLPAPVEAPPFQSISSVTPYFLEDTGHW